MDRYGLIGNPISHSRSPELFRAAYGGRHAYDLIEKESFSEAWQCFLQDYKAINITTPFKTDAYAEVLRAAVDGKGSISGPCLKTGATNLVVRGEDGSLNAYNSDFSGVILAVAENCFPGLTAQCLDVWGARAHIKVHQFMKENIEEFYGRRPQALVIGCGGAGRAAAVATAEMGFATALVNRTPEKAQALASSLPEYGFICVPVSDLKGAFRECDLIVYTLPAALDGLDTLGNEDFITDAEGLGKNVPKMVLEANYRSPSFTGDLAARMNDSGCRYIPGQQWLLGQAVSGYALMTSEVPDAKAMAEALSV
jgi:shikimate dehydrogenase